MPIKPHRPLKPIEQEIAKEMFKRVAGDDAARALADPVGELSAEEEQAAADAGAGIIYHGVPPRLADLVAPDTLGAVDLPDPEPDPVPVDVPAAVAEALAPLTSTSTTAQIRTALLNLRAALG